MWPNHLNLISRNFCPSSTTPVLLLTYSFLNLSFLVFPMENLSIFISATSILFSFVLVAFTLCNLPISLSVTLLSHIPPVILFHAPSLPALSPSLLSLILQLPVLSTLGTSTIYVFSLHLYCFCCVLLIQA